MSTYEDPTGRVRGSACDNHEERLRGSKEGREEREPILIHVGYPKAASSWIQGALFRATGTGFHMVDREIVDECIISPGCFDFDRDLTQNKVVALAERVKENGRVPVLSSELLCGNAKLNGGMDAKLYADRLFSVLPNARILVVIREQKSWLESFYKMQIQLSSETEVFERFLGGNRPLDAASGFSLRFLEYSKLVGYYHGLFGRENVLVIPFEELAKSPEGFCSSIFEFSGCKPLRGWSPSTDRINAGMQSSAVEFWLGVNWLKRQGWRVLPSPGSPSWNVALRMFSRQSVVRKFRNKINEMIGGRFAESNRRLQELVDFDLAAWEYEL